MVPNPTEVAEMHEDTMWTRIRKRLFEAGIIEARLRKSEMEETGTVIETAAQGRYPS